MDSASKKTKYRRWVLVNTFMMLLMLGFILTVSSSRVDMIFSITAPLSLAIFGTFMVDHLLSYFECMTREKVSNDKNVSAGD